ncbi:MAG: DUF4242 domain-containing protein [Alphaproteobacteria bacterium]|nr:MAG: DUF4242 domain-containing protein [Alphaproteobacteria bacterium]
MRRFVIERDLPKIGDAGPEELKGAAKTSNDAIAKVGSVLWEHSYVTADKTFCIYQAEDEEAIRQHAAVSGFPATKITEILREISPATAD